MQIYIYISAAFGLIYGLGHMIHFMQTDSRGFMFKDDTFKNYMIRGFLGILITLLASIVSMILFPVIILETIIKGVKR